MLSSTFNHRRRRPGRDRWSRKPCLLVLEDRTLPSTLTVLNNADHGDGLLRAAITNAQSGDQIIFDPSLRGQTIALTSGELTIDKSLDLEGLGADQLAVSGNHQSRVFDISGAVTVTIAGLTITDGLAFTSTTPAQGGGILNHGADLTLDDVILTDNEALGADATSLGGTGSSVAGGGIYSFGGALTLTGASITNNQALGGNGASRVGRGGDGGYAAGAGLYAVDGALDISGSRAPRGRLAY